LLLFRRSHGKLSALATYNELNKRFGVWFLVQIEFRTIRNASLGEYNLDWRSMQVLFVDTEAIRN
jgi:hypothetical protein